MWKRIMTFFKDVFTVHANSFKSVYHGGGNDDDVAIVSVDSVLLILIIAALEKAVM